MLLLDQKLFFFIYNFSGRAKVIDFLIIFFGKYLLYFLILFLIFLILKSWQKKEDFKIKIYLFSLFLALFARFGVASLIRFFYHRERPFLYFSLPHLISDNSFSFPSGHTIFLFTLATSLYFINKKLAYFLYIFSILIGLSRIAGGIHYPSDILGGAILGIAIGILGNFFFKKFIKKN